MKTKRKYEPKTGEEWLQHAAVYLYTTYKSSRIGWCDEDARQAYRAIGSLLRDLGDGNK